MHNMIMKSAHKNIDWICKYRIRLSILNYNLTSNKRNKKMFLENKKQCWLERSIKILLLLLV